MLFCLVTTGWIILTLPYCGEFNKINNQSATFIYIYIFKESSPAGLFDFENTKRTISKRRETKFYYCITPLLENSLLEIWEVGVGGDPFMAYALFTTLSNTTSSAKRKRRLLVVQLTSL